jgi:hypothetical protein
MDSHDVVWNQRVAIELSVDEGGHDEPWEQLNAISIRIWHVCQTYDISIDKGNNWWAVEQHICDISMTKRKHMQHIYDVSVSNVLNIP